MITCRKATELMTTSELRSLSWKERLELKVHIVLCAACRSLSEQLSTIRAAVKADVDTVPGKDFIDALERRLKNHVG